jgi:heavy metal sensor kinase
MKFFKTVRFRLTAWYLLVTMLLLAAFGGTAYFLLSYNLHHSLDQRLVARATGIREALELAPGNTSVSLQPDEVLLIYFVNGSLAQDLGPEMNAATAQSLASQAFSGQSKFLTAATADGRPVRLYAVSVATNMGTSALVAGYLLTDIESALATFRAILFGTSLAAAVLAAGIGLFLASRALRPVAQMTATSREIGAGSLSSRLSQTSDDELGRLAATLNEMFQRLETGVQRERRFTSDASHELRTPLAIIQGEATLSLGRARSADEYRASLESIAWESNYMAELIGRLLFLAHSDAGREKPTVQPVDLRGLLAGALEDLAVLAQQKGVVVNTTLAESLPVSGDALQLRQLFLNLLDNAVRYTPEGGTVSIAGQAEGENVKVEISDTGPGIPTEALPHIFERFYRVNPSRERAEGGFGLGLAIARSIAEQHHGSIEVTSEPGHGSTFIVRLPLAL